jgi:hypothetical protein
VEVICGSHLPETRRAQLCIRRAELRCVVQVESLHPELEALHFAHRELFKQTDVPRLDPWLAEGIPPDIAELQIGKLKGPGVEPETRTRVRRVRITPGT